MSDKVKALFPKKTQKGLPVKSGLVAGPKVAPWPIPR